MAVDLSYLQKLWNRGVDVGVGVVTSVIIGFIGLLFYRGKLWLDEQRQRQEIRIAAEEAARVRHQEAQDRRRGLVDEREAFLTAANNAGNQHDLAEVWDAYLAWLESQELHRLPVNLTTITTLRLWGTGLRGTTVANVLPNRQHMVRVISNTELPPEE
jgi:hypothetical protein